jgi:hypothetical protein
MHMRGTGVEKEVEICVTNVTNAVGLIITFEVDKYP